MKLDKERLIKPIGWIAFLMALGLFCLQMGYFYVNARFEAEYIDSRLFYIINILCFIFLTIAILLLLQLDRRFKFVVAGSATALIIVHAMMLVSSNQSTTSVTSLSPGWKNVLSIKENRMTGEAVYYRPYYGILGRPKESLPHETVGEFKVDWLADDVAAVTYRTEDNTIQQHIGTYGDRGSGISYYYVGSEINGRWLGEGFSLLSDTQGITVDSPNGTSELFLWEDIHQFGTLAVVLMKNNEAAWTISLDENFQIDSATSERASGTITLYEATMEENEPITLQQHESF